MKKIIGFGGIIVIILGVLLGYRFVYKVSPREFITKDTRIIYANEKINSKDFTEIFPFIANKDRKAELEKEIKNLRYISKVYMFSNEEFYMANEKSFMLAIDTGYWYFLALKEIKNSFEPLQDVYVLKPEIRDKYFKELNGDIYMKNYKGLFLFSMSEKLLKDFIGKEKNYMYNRNIEEILDVNVDNLLGTLIYNNSGVDYYGVELITSTGDIDKNYLKTEGKIILDEESSKKYQSSIQDRKLLKYVDKNDIYISVDDFSNLDNLFFNPYTVGGGLDKQTILAIWKGIFGIDLEKIFKEIDGELVIRRDKENIGLMVALKNPHSEVEKFLKFLADGKSMLGNLELNYTLEDNILTVGDKFVENSKGYQLNKGVFLFGEMDITDILEVPDFKIKLLGEGKEIKLETRISAETVRELTREY